MKPLISVIIPVYNHAAVLARCISSLNKQVYQPLEVIIVNDGSTDNFKQVIKNILVNNEYQRLNRKVISQANKGAAAARNIGFSQCKGDYVIFWDADTTAQPNMLTKMYQTLKNNPQASYVYSQFKYGAKKVKSYPFAAQKLKQLNYIDTTSLIRKKDFVGFDETLKRFQDWDLWLSLLAKNKTGIFIPEVLFYKIIKGRKGISNWLPSFVYKLPWKGKRVQEYEQAKEIIKKKHNLK